MSSDKFTMATVEEVTLDVIIAIRGRYPKRPEKNCICNYLIAFYGKWKITYWKLDWHPTRIKLDQK